MPSLREFRADNEQTFEEVLRLREQLVPFIGAGFSCPICPGWGQFLVDYRRHIEENFLTEPDLEDYRKIDSNCAPDRFEKLANFLLAKSGRQEFMRQLRYAFEIPCPPEHSRKFHGLHRAFPGLKITTNYDALIENNHPKGLHVEVARGNRPEDLERLFTLQAGNALLKIHGDFGDAQSIVLSSRQYQDLYGDPTNFDREAPLPKFLIRLFTNSPVLFIGCSLQSDRVLAVLQSLPQVRPHFALMKRPESREERVAINRRLSNFQIRPLWFQEYDQILDVLEALAPALPSAIARPEPVSAFVGRGNQLEGLREALERGEGSIQTISGRLFHVEGAGGVGKTTLALEALQRFGHLAKDGALPPFRADEMNAQAFALALSRALGIDRVPTLADERAAHDHIGHLLERRNCLIILDNALDWPSLRGLLPEKTRSILIVTTRDRDLAKHLRLNLRNTLAIEEIRLTHFTREEALELFRELLGTEYRDTHETLYAEIAEQLGYLPVALRPVIALMQFSPHYPAREVLDKFRSDGRLSLVRKGQAKHDSDARTIDAVFDLASPTLGAPFKDALAMLATCAPGPVPLSFLKIFGQDPDIGERLEELYTYSWCERREASAEREYEIHQLIREMVFERFGRGFDAQFVSTIDNLFLDPATPFKVKDRLIAELNEAIEIADRIADDRVILWLFLLFEYLTFRGHLSTYLRVTEVVESKFGHNQSLYASALGNRALILKAQGEMKQAMELYQNVQEIIEGMGDQMGLAACYGNQALILKDWGKLNEAMELHRKAEEIYKVTKNHGGIATSYCNQALILMDWGKLDEAMELFHKEKEIYETWGDCAALARNYGNQALILLSWGKLNEAMELHQKEEKICDELGDCPGLARSYGNQAAILEAWGQFDEAMELHHKEESICEELGDRVGLARSWWNQGIVHGMQGRKDQLIELWKRSIETNRAIGIPVANFEQALNALLDPKPPEDP